MLRLISSRENVRFKQKAVARLKAVIASASNWLRLAFANAFPSPSDPDPGGIPPLAKSNALREGALLREEVEELKSGKRVA